VGRYPHAPWTLEGQSVVAWAPGRAVTSPLPPELRPLPGPCLVAGVDYATSPVGPYRELVVAQPARLGLRPGLCITTMVVDARDTKVAGRLNWGFPKELGTLTWTGDADQAELRWVERDLTVRGVAVGPVLPVLAIARALQRRSDGPVVVPLRVRGRGRLARVSIDVGDAADPLAGLAGRHRGVLVSGLRFVIHPARHAAGLTSTLRAPLRAPEPALSLGPRGD
jgi:Acetoacetate decarboxylase (ADC)